MMARPTLPSDRGRHAVSRRAFGGDCRRCNCRAPPRQMPGCYGVPCRVLKLRAMRNISLGTFTRQNDADGFEQHDDVEKQRVILDVVEIVLQFLHGVIDGGRRSDSAPGPSR